MSNVSENNIETSNSEEKRTKKLLKGNQSTTTKPSGLYYDVADNPPIHLAAMFGFQITMANIFWCVNMSVIIAQMVCADQQFAAKLFSTSAVMSGICTVLQTLLGLRLPIYQGPSILFTIPYMAATTDPAWKCNQQAADRDVNSTATGNETLLLSQDKPWMEEWRKVQGSMIAAAFFHMAIGAVGLGGLLLRLMGPISITCLILMLGISVHGILATFAEVHWGLSCLNLLIVIVLSQYVNFVNIPLPSWSRRAGFKFKPFPLFELFPVLLSVIIGWVITYILTVNDVLPDDPDVLQYQARTDFAQEDIRNAPVFTFPYPGQFGMPSIKASYVVMMAAAACGSILESVGDYVQTSASCRVPDPPPHAVNRAILMEGFGSLVCSVLGAGHATTSYSNMIGIIGITKVASRRVFVFSGLFLIILGMFGKLGAALVAIPKPVVAAPAFISIALLVGAALSNLRKVDMLATRTQAVLGIAIMGGMVFPSWLLAHPGTFATGSSDLDQILQGILGVPLIVSVILAMILDLTVPGDSRLKTRTPITMENTTESENEFLHSDEVPGDLSVYDPPFMGLWVSHQRLLKYIPFLPGLKKP